MISARMSRRLKVFLVSSATVAVAVFAAACGTERISVPKTSAAYPGAVLFSQRCGGCHSLSYAGTHGSASNIRTRLPTNGPNFNIRCERPAIRVLFAIENGGFSGAIMPQNIVVGKQAQEVALFVSTYAGHGSQAEIGQPTCQSQAIGAIPLATATAAAAVSPATTTATTTTTPTTTTAAGAAVVAAHKKAATKAKTKAAKAKAAHK
jgi:hypothetical protein